MPQHKLIATKDMRYQTRMLRAGDPLVMDAPLARVYHAIKAVRKPTTEEKAKHWPPKPTPVEHAVPAVSTQTIVAPPAKAAPKARAKKSTRKKA